MEENKNGRTLGGLQKEIEDLKQRLALMDADNSALLADLEHWKKVAAGAKGRNKQLAERVEHYKNHDLEGDVLYEKALADIDAKNKIIDGLHSQVTELSNKVNKLNDEKVKLKTENTDLGIALKYEQLPWWKKMFR
jgi:regulator of replication initiation timing